LCRPKDVYICNGSKEEYNKLCQDLVACGTFIKVNEKNHPNCYYCRSDPADTARVEDRTYICCKNKDDAGPTNNWMEPSEMKKTLNPHLNGCMEGRTMYVIPFSMGPLGSPLSAIGIQITDSAYVVVNMKIMTRMGSQVLDLLGTDKFFVRAFHSVGYPLPNGKTDVAWPCDATHKYIVHFPEERSIISYGSGYGGNALLGKKCFALRIASAMARDEGWLAEHMLILGITSPSGEKKYITGAFPSQCGKTNLSMVTSLLPGWKVETVGDDIAWLRFGKDGRLYAVNPETGFFGVAPGTGPTSNPNALKACSSDTIFTNVGLTEDNDVWWEDMSKEPPKKGINWTGHEWTPASKDKMAHPNARFTAPIQNCPCLDENWDNAEGVPISAMLFGGRRSTLVPLVRQSFDWKHGVFLGATCCSETTAANMSEVGKVRHDPFAMLPFCGYNMADYFAHWLSIESKAPDASKLPKIFFVNWFRKDSKGHWLWPGFSDNVRILKWIFERCNEEKNFVETPIGLLPDLAKLDMKGLNISKEALQVLFNVNNEEWMQELEEIKGYLGIFGNRIPKAIMDELMLLESKVETKK
jgi:phosphoenolpyruvate carboxykinase (GTP)